MNDSTNQFYAHAHKCVTSAFGEYSYPDLTFGDIYLYLIDTPSIYTKESMKAYKSLEAYRYVMEIYRLRIYIFFVLIAVSS
jgi:hypothetical protein